MELKVVKEGPGTLYSMFYNEVFVGEIYMEVDGYYVATLFKRGEKDVASLFAGYVDSVFLRAIADKLDEMNKDWDAKIKNDPYIGGG